jgi:NAD(P)H-dependent flavin oxidoreductase YrpB (nitropropane dioxygenase family)
MATKEAPIHENIKRAIVAGGVGDSTLVMRGVKNTERVYKNAAVLKVQELEGQYPGDFSKIHEYVKGTVKGGVVVIFNILYLLTIITQHNKITQHNIT